MSRKSCNDLQAIEAETLTTSGVDQFHKSTVPRCQRHWAVLVVQRFRTVFPKSVGSPTPLWLHWLGLQPRNISKLHVRLMYPFSVGWAKTGELDDIYPCRWLSFCSSKVSKSIRISWAFQAQATSCLLCWLNSCPFSCHKTMVCFAVVPLEDPPRSAYVPRSSDAVILLESS